MLKSLELRRFSTESHFTWQLDVEHVEHFTK